MRSAKPWMETEFKRGVTLHHQMQMSFALRVKVSPPPVKANLDDLHIEQIVLHQVRRYREVNGSDLPRPILAKKASKIGAAERAFLQERIRDSAGGHKVAAIRPSAIHVKQGNENPGRLAELIRNPKSLVETSQEMVRNLVVAQGHIRGADYLLAIGTGLCKGARVVFLFTMTIESGMRAIIKDDEPPTLQEVRDLVLDKGATLDKMVALEADGVDATGIVEDTLVGKSEAATYFLQTFLGYETADSARKQTQSFYTAVKELVNKQVASQEDRLKITRALSTEVQSQADTISISEFRKKHIPSQYQPAYDELIEKKQLPKGKIARDPTLLTTQKKQTTYHLSNGVKLTVPAGDAAKFIEAGQDSKGDYVTIRARVEKIS